MRKLLFPALALLVAAGAFLALSGCSRDDGGHDAGKKSPVEDGHTHKPGAHGGIIVEIGRDNYHAEAVFERGGLVKLYTLGQDEAKIIDIESQTLAAYVKKEGDPDAVEMTFNPSPRPGDKEGRTSQFIGKLPAELVGKQLAITIPSI